MREYDATEIAYKNGYEAAVRDMIALLNLLPEDKELKKMITKEPMNV